MSCCCMPCNSTKRRRRPSRDVRMRTDDYYIHTHTQQARYDINSIHVYWELVRLYGAVLPFEVDIFKRVALLPHNFPFIFLSLSPPSSSGSKNSHFLLLLLLLSSIRHCHICLFGHIESMISCITNSICLINGSMDNILYDLSEQIKGTKRVIVGQCERKNKMLRKSPFYLPWMFFCC